MINAVFKLGSMCLTLPIFNQSCEPSTHPLSTQSGMTGGATVAVVWFDPFSRGVGVADRNLATWGWKILATTVVERQLGVSIFVSICKEEEATG